MKILFTNARVLTMVADVITHDDVVVDGNLIVYIGKDSSSYGPFDRVIDCHKNLLMPGFKNAHAHSAMVFLRGKADDVALQDWLFKIVFPREDRLQPEDIYHLNKVAYLEYIASGITACFDHYYYPLEAAKAAQEVGMRTLLLATYDAKYMRGEELEGNYHSFNDIEDNLVKYAIGFHAEYTTSDYLLDGTKKTLASLKCPFFTHISETKKEVEECKQRHGKTPAKYLYDEGLFKYGGGGFHCVHFTKEEAKIFKDNNLTVISCPGSNSKLASGIAPLTYYFNEGINIALGTDGPASNNSLDMFKEMYLAATLQKLMNNDPKSIPAFEVLKMATVNGARAMGLDKADILAVGKYADIILIDLYKPNMQPLNNIVTNLVYAGSKDNIILTMINGKILYENGQFFLKETPEEIYKKAEEITLRLEKEL